MTEEPKTLRDKLAVYLYTELHKHTLESELKSIENDMPDILRFLADDLESTEPHAVNEINLLTECADYLESLHLEPLPEGKEYWKWHKRFLGEVE